MSQKITRRDLFKFAGGAALGIGLTPVPWKMLDDVAIWTQRGHQEPRLPRGDFSTRYTTCTLCPASCGLRVRCCNGRPVSMTGIPGHPTSRGALCPLGLGAHHLAYHPRRLLEPVALSQLDGQTRSVRSQASDVVAALANAIRNAESQNESERIAILDCRPGRAISGFYRRFLARLSNGVYLRAPCVEEAWLSTLQGMLEEPYGPIGCDLENTRLILSFGEPVLEGWGAPGRMLELGFGAVRRDFRPEIIQVETRPSHTALLADRWLAIRPGAEIALALGLAHVIVAEHLHDEVALPDKALDLDLGGHRDYRRLIQPFTPQKVADLTGLSSREIVETARAFATQGPSIALGGGDAGGGPLGREEEVAIWGLNLLVGSVGRHGGWIPRREIPEPADSSADAGVAATDLGDLPDGALRVLILDGAAGGSALPWSLLERKLAERNALVVSLSPYLVGHARHANWVAPAPANLEAVEETTSLPSAARASLALATPLLPAPPGAVDPVALITRVAIAAGLALPEGLSARTLIDARLRAVYGAGRGHVFNASTTELQPLGLIPSPEAFIEIMNAGACWVDDATHAPPLPRFRLLGREPGGFERLASRANGRWMPNISRSAEYPLVLMPFGWKGIAGGGPVTGLISKLYRESGLRPEPRCVVLNPETAAACGVREGRAARLATPRGEIEVDVRLDSQVRPGVLHAAVGPDPDQLGEEGRGFIDALYALCEDRDRKVWRAAPANLREA